MKYSKKEIGEGLLEELNKGYDIERISNWAGDLYISMEDNQSPELNDLLHHIFMMDAGPEFEYPAQELRLLANKLIDDGNKEELSQPILDIKDTAQDLENNWLMCPLCQEVWEDSSGDAMVCCPKCNNKLHNPSFKKL